MKAFEKESVPWRSSRTGPSRNRRSRSKNNPTTNRKEDAMSQKPRNNSEAENGRTRPPRAVRLQLQRPRRRWSADHRSARRRCRHAPRRRRAGFAPAEVPRTALPDGAGQEDAGNARLRGRLDRQKTRNATPSRRQSGISPTRRTGNGKPEQLGIEKEVHEQILANGGKQTNGNRSCSPMDIMSRQIGFDAHLPHCSRSMVSAPSVSTRRSADLRRRVSRGNDASSAGSRGHLPEPAHPGNHLHARSA